LCNTIPENGLIRDDEDLHDLQLNGLRILQKQKGFRYGMDPVLLADFTQSAAAAHVVDFGTGTGILPLLLYGRGRLGTCDAFEIQPEIAGMASRSMALNHLGDRIRVHALPLQEALTVLAPCSVDAVICNPPYGQPGTTLLNPAETLSTARHQSDEGLLGWFRMAHRLLKGKGKMTMVYPAPRMLEVMDLLRQAHLEPKRFRLIYPYADKPANLVLIEAMKDARPMLHPMPPLIVYEADGSMTPELRRIYHMV